MANSTEIGTAYLRVKPKVDNSFERDIESAGGRAGSGFGGAFQVAVGNILANIAEQAVQTIGGALKDAFNSYADYEQLVGGVEKIFDQMDTSRIFADAQSAYKELNMSANEYMSTINQVGAAFSATMGDEAAYDAARKGMQAISDYASGTGLDINELNDKFRIISKSTQSYQSVCDQFAGILPQTADDFLRQAQAAGYLSDQYTSLTEVPVGEYQQALVEMMAQGVEGLSLTGNTLHESSETISGSLAALEAAWSNFLVGVFDENADMDTLANNLVTSIGWAFNNVTPAIMQAASSLFSVIPQAFMTVLEENFPGIFAVLSQVADAFAPGIEAMQRIGAEVAPLVQQALQTLGAVAEEFLLPAVVELGNSFSDFMTAIEPWAPNLVTIASVIGEVLIVVLSELVRELSVAFETIATVTQAITDFAESIGITPEKIRSFTTNAQHNFQVFKEVGMTVFNAVSSVIERFATIIGNVIGTVQSFYETVSSIFGNVYSTITGTMQNVGDFIWGIINDISNAFSSITVSWPHIPLPYFRWHWESVGGMINIPWFDGIDWYGMGGFVDDATLIGAGERGGELIWPSYEPYLGRYADAIASRINDNDDIASLREDLRNMRLVLAIDGRAFAEATVGDIDRAMGTMSRRAVAR